ncbi:MAG: transglycosylase SLT domain-containing protein, partial [Muribaculaceae bacterium]|nr:transglycosylase SLT domain-containing protein [Muribaculaceae bacterium]
MMNPRLSVRLRRLVHTGSALLIAGTFALTGFAAPRAASVRDVNSANIDLSKVVVPESFETDVHKMMTNWYLQKYAVLDEKADSKPTITATDQDYIERLSKIERVIELPYNDIVRNFIKMYVERKKGLVETMLGMSLYYMPIFENALGKYDLPFELKYLPVIESALNPNAVSRAGAAGLWQFMPGTAIDEGLEVNSLVDERRDPYRSSDAAAKYLKKLYNTFGNWSLAIAAYNCGPGNVTKAIKRAGGGSKDFWEIYPFLPAETRDYIPAYIAACYAMENFGHHGISPALAREPITIDTVHVTKRIHFQQISDVLDIPMEELRILNPQYRQDLIPGNVRPYPLALPHLQVYNFIAQQDTIVNHDAEKYARRDVVQPSNGQTVSKTDSATQNVTKYHKVKKGETLASIARKYGVTESSIQRANGMGSRKSVKRGQTLKIVTAQTVEKTENEAKTAEQSVAELVNTVSASERAVDTTAVNTDTVPAPAPEKVTPATRVSGAMNNNNSKAGTQTKNNRKNNNSNNSTKKAAATHKVQSGETLWRISNKYGVT